MTTLREELLKAVQSRTASTVRPDIFYQETRIRECDIDHDLFDKRFQQFSVLTWTCTDTTVGIFAITLDGTLVAYTTQEARKSYINIYYMSCDCQDAVVKAVFECTYTDSAIYQLASDDILDTDIEHVNVFDNRLLATEFPCLNALGITVEVSDDVYTAYHDTKKLLSLTHRQVDVIEKCATRFEGTTQFFVDIFFKIDE